MFAHVGCECHSRFPCDALTGYWTSWPYHTFHSGNVSVLYPVPGLFSYENPDSTCLCFYKGRSCICTKHHHGCVGACSSLPCSWNYDHSLCVSTWNQGQLNELSCAVPTYFWMESSGHSLHRQNKDLCGCTYAYLRPVWVANFLSHRSQSTTPWSTQWWSLSSLIEPKDSMQILHHMVWACLSWVPCTDVKLAVVSTGHEALVDTLAVSTFSLVLSPDDTMGFFATIFSIYRLCHKAAYFVDQCVGMGKQSFWGKDHFVKGENLWLSWVLVHHHSQSHLTYLYHHSGVLLIEDCTLKHWLSLVLVRFPHVGSRCSMYELYHTIHRFQFHSI